MKTNFVHGDPMPIRAILFDLDNTLTHRDLTVQAYAQYLTTVYVQSLRQQDTQNVIEIIRRIDNGGYPKRELLTQPSIGGSVADALLSTLDWHIAPDLETLTQFWFEHFGRNAVAMPEAEKLLQQLKHQGYRLAVVSNGGHATRLAILEGLGFTQYFDVIVSSGLVGQAKPHADIFLYAVDQLGVEVEECIFIGDHPMNDVQGAAEAGMQAIWFEGFHTGHSVDVPHFRIQNLNQIHEILQRIE